MQVRKWLISGEINYNVCRICSLTLLPPRKYSSRLRSRWVWHGGVVLVGFKLIWKTNWLPSVLWHCWFGHMTC